MKVRPDNGNLGGIAETVRQMRDLVTLNAYVRV